jgi:hypothetical protein
MGGLDSLNASTGLHIGNYNPGLLILHAYIGLYKLIHAFVFFFLEIYSYRHCLRTGEKKSD